MQTVELSVHVAQAQITVGLDGDTFVPEALVVPDAWIAAISADVAALDTLVRTWSPREQARFRSLKRGVGLALSGLLLGRPELLDELEDPPETLPTLQPTALDRELTIALRQTVAGAGLIRLLLSFDDPDWAALPWELMLWPDHGEVPLATDPRIALVRRAAASDPGVRPVADGRPKVLATVSDPASFGLAAPLESTWQGISAQLTTHLGAQADVLTTAAEDLDALLDRMSGFSVIVALAHGTARLRIMLPRDHAAGGPPFFEVDAQQFRARFAAGGAPRLAILVMCYSAGSDTAQDRQSAAEALIAGGCAAVVAMHGTVYLPAAEVFVGTTCAQLADGQSIDVAVQRARAALARFGEAHAHAESPDHAFRPRLFVRQSADLAPIFVRQRARRWPLWAGGAAVVALAALITIFAWPDPAPAPAVPLVEVPQTTVAGLHSKYRPVTVSPFSISPTRVTQAQWIALMEHNPAWEGPHRKGAPSFPVERVAYFEVFEYLNRLSTAAGLPACYVLADCTGTPSLGCPGDATGCVGDGYQCATAQQRPGCTGYRLPSWTELTAALVGDAPLPKRADQREIRRRLYLAPHTPGAPVGSGAKNALGIGDFDDARMELVWPPGHDGHMRCGCARVVAGRCTDVTCGTDTDRTYRGRRVGFRVARSE